MEINGYLEIISKILLNQRWNRKRFVFVITFIFGAIILTPFLNLYFEDLAAIYSLDRLSYWVSFESLPFDSRLIFYLFLSLFWIAVFLSIKVVIHFILLTIRATKTFFNEFGIFIYKLSLNEWPKDWVTQGGICLEEYKIKKENKQQLIVSLSNSGCLIPGKWKNFEMSFDLIFPEEESRAVGIVFRAQDLENYFMLQIRAWKQENFEVNIKPHIRFYGNWEVIDLGKKDLLNSVKFQSTNSPLSVKLKVSKQFACIYANSKIMFQWALPSNTEINVIQYNLNNQNNSGNDDSSKGKGGLVPNIHFRETYGKIGFRAYPGERAVIRSLEIKSIF